MALRKPGKSKDARPDAGKRRRHRAAKATVAVLPTLLTLGNLLSGGAAIFLASRPPPPDPETTLPWGLSALFFAAACIFLGMVFDGLDGRIARLTGTSSELGEQLDSMADMVTFGVAPAFLAVQLVGIGTPFLSEKGDAYFDRMTLLIAGIYVACTALRLARFNMEMDEPEEADHLSFKGLPSPGAAGTVASMILLHQYFLVHLKSNYWLITLSEVGMAAIMLLVAFAMVSHLRYVHVLNRYFQGRARFGTMTRIVVVLLLLMIDPPTAIASAFVIYAVSAPGLWLWQHLIGGRLGWFARTRQG